MPSALDFYRGNPRHPQGGLQPLLRLSDGVFVRASAAWRVSDDGSQVTAFGSGALRNVGGRYVLEGAGTQIISDMPQQIDDTPGDWSKTDASGTYVVTANFAVDPLGTTKAARHAYGANASDVANGDVAALAGTTLHRGSVFARAVSGTPSFRIGIGDQLSADIPVTTSWARYSATATTGAAPTNLFRLYNGSGASAASILFWGAHLQTGAPHIGTSPILAASGTRAADDLTFASLPTDMRTKGFWFYVWPYFSNTGQASHGTTQGLLFAAGGVNYVQLNSTNEIRVRTSANNPWAQSSALTYSARQRLTIVVDFTNAQLRIAGATTGNGTTAGVASDSLLATNYRVGATVAGTSPYYGEISDFYPLSTAPV